MNISMSPYRASYSTQGRVAAPISMGSTIRLEKPGKLSQHREDICPGVSPRSPDNLAYVKNKL